MTEFAKELQRDQNNVSALFEHYHNFVEMARQVNLAQMEVNVARTRLDLASNQEKLARAFLLEQQYAEDSINITSVEIQEQLGLKLAERKNILGDRALVSVERISFSTSMTSTTKTLLPFVAYVQTAKGERRSVEFPMDFKRVNHSLALASKLVVKTLFGTDNSRKRRSTRIGSSNDEPGIDTGERMCFFSYQANSFFDDIIHSLEFLLKVTRELFHGISQGLHTFHSHYKHSGENSSTPSQQPLESLEWMMRSLKSHYTNSTAGVTWDRILGQWRASLNVLIRYKNFTECSGSQDCVDYFFHTLDEFYLFEYGDRAMEIKNHLEELNSIFAGLLYQNLSFPFTEEITHRARVLLNKTKDDSVLCGTGPIITESSSAEVVVFAGDTTRLTCRVQSTSEVEILWTKNERILDGMTGGELVLTNVNTETEGAYKCKASNNRGRVESNVTIVKVHQEPRIIEHPDSMQVLTGTEKAFFVCLGSGVPHPSTEWFFIPMHDQAEEVVRLNFSKPVLKKENLTSGDSGFYFCNVSNIHGTLQSRKARLDVVGFAPGTPRVVVSLKFAECLPGDLLKSSPNCTEDSRKAAQHLDILGLYKTFRAMRRYMDWSWGQIEKIHLSLRRHASVSFLLQGSTLGATSNYSPSYLDALDRYSLSHFELAKALKSFRSAVDARTFTFPWKNVVIVAQKGSFEAEIYTQKCPIGTSAEKKGFICVNCPRGHYAAENGTCLQCPAGTYQPNERSTICLKCPFIRSLTQLGAVKESQCTDISTPCKPPNNVKHTKVLNESKTQYHTGDSVVLECKPGYRAIGNGTVECNEGNWTTRDFYCESEACYPPWHELTKHCYQVVDVLSFKWDDAQAKCQSLRSQMVVISTAKENVFTAQLIKAYTADYNITKVTAWLGLRKVDAKAQFQWVDGTALDGYSNWSPGEPNNVRGVELCTEILASGKWTDVPCTTDYKAITVCEKPLQNGE